MNLLAIETSADHLSLALSAGGRLVGVHSPAGQRQAERILGEIDSLLAGAGLGVADLHAIAYGEGPGSFTGLRIACSVVQGLAFARSLPVIGVGTLLALAEECGSPRVIACIDARMGEVYHAAYLRSAAGTPEPWRQIHPPSLCRPGEVPRVEGAGWIGCGSGFAAHGDALAQRLGEALASVRADSAPRAEAVLRLALPRLERGETMDAARAVPVYLRERVALKTSER